jgi:hypothetical protein
MADVTYTGQIVREAPEIEAYKLGLLKEAQRLYAEQPLTLPAYEAAGLSQSQLQAANLAKQGIGAYEPYIQAGSTGLTQGQNLAQAAARGIAGIDVSPQYGQAQMGMEGALRAAGGALSPDFTTSQGYLTGAAQRAAGATGGYDPRMAQGYMNPYQEAVTQNTMRELQRQGAIQQQGAAAQAVKSGAFGSTREGVQRAEMARGLSDVMARQIAQDYAQNYQQAQQAAMQGYEAQQQRSLAAANQLGQIGSQFGQQAATGTQLQQAGAGLMGQLSQGIGSLAGQQAGIDIQRGQLLGQLGQGIGSMGVQQAALGQLHSQLNQGDVALLSQLGAQEQQNAQAQLDAQRMTNLQRTMSPYQQLGFVSDIYKGAPTSQMALTSQSAPSASPMQQIVGTAVGAASTAAGVNKLFG